MRNSLVFSPLTRLEMRYRAMYLSSAELPFRGGLLTGSTCSGSKLSACKLGLSLNLPLTQCQVLVYLMSSEVKIITLNTQYFFDRKLNCVCNLTSKSLNISWLRDYILTSGFVPENESVLAISVLFTCFWSVFM